MRVIDFSPPMQGIAGEFNTFRLGGAWSRRLQPGERVALLDKKEMRLIGFATVAGVHTGKLDAMSAQHGFRNHNQKHLPTEGAGERVVQAMIKRYGPQKCRDTSLVTVIELKEFEYGNDATGQPVHVREIQR